MYRVTTPEHTFTLPESISNYKVVQVAYKQSAFKLVKTYADGEASSGMSISGDTVIVTLTQEETKKFKKGDASVQVRALTTCDRAVASKHFPFTIEDVNNEDILK